MTEVPPQFFDVQSGELLVGHAAMDDHLAAGGHPGDLLPLGEALALDDEDLPIEN